MLLSTLKQAARSKTNQILKELLQESKTASTISAAQRKTTKMNEEFQNTKTLQQQQQGKEMLTASLTASRVEAATAPKPKLRHEKQQQAARKKLIPYVPGTVSLQVLGAGANGAPCSVYLFTDQSRYLFNCGEGTQRLAHEHKTKLARLEQIFVTRNTWTTIGGFPGLALTVQDAGVRELALHGPPHLDSILHSMKRFVVLKNLQVKTKDCTQMHDFEDAVMSVKCIPLRRDASADLESTDVSNDQTVVAYICQLKPRPGALNLEKCVEHGVPPGPLLGLLKNGIDVTLNSGKVVKSKDVSEPSEMALSFVFLDIPSPDYLPALQAQAAKFHDSIQNDLQQQVSLVVHFTPVEMLQNNCYQSFASQFPTQTQHIYLNSPQNCFSGYVAAHRIQYQLNQLNPRVFPLLDESAALLASGGLSLSNKLKKTKLIEAEENVEKNNDKKQTSEEAGINSMTNFHLRPRKGLDRTLEAKLNPSEYINETEKLEDFPALLAQLKADLKSQQPTKTVESYPKITFLGTGSCIPNKTRNVSSILVQTQANSYILLDCGEGTLGQIVRFYGKTQAEEVIRQLKVIYVSHLHADHHIGLIGLLVERKRLQSSASIDKMLLLAPKQIEPWLDFYNTRIETIADAYKLVGNGELLEQPWTFNDSPLDMGVASISTCLVRHCAHSFGVSLTLNALHDEKPIKITYSGDTMPCQDLIELGRDSTILIHEATMEDDLVDEAKFKMHSTITQAIQQGRAMQAQHIVLTHFSQRYAKLPRMQSGEDETQAMQNVAIAFDNMQITLAELPHFHLLYPALRALFAEHTDVLEQKALKRELKLERKRKLMNSE